jgi:hypothetical protein
MFHSISCGAGKKILQKYSTEFPALEISKRKIVSSYVFLSSQNFSFE